MRKFSIFNFQFSNSGFTLARSAKGNSLGFTLVETLVASGVALIVGTLLVGILVNHSGLSYKENALVNEGLSLNDAMGKIDNNIRESAAVAIGYPESTPTYTTGNSVLVLKLPALSSSGTIENVYDYAVIAADITQPKVLRLQIFPDSQSIRQPANTVLTTLLNSVTFNYLDRNGNSVTPADAFKVSVNLSVLSQTGSIGSSRSSVSTTSLRNYSK